MRGDAGAGKPMLLDRLIYTAADAMFTVVAMTGVQAEGGVPFAALSSISTALANNDATAELRTHLSAGSHPSALDLGGATLAALAEASTACPVLIVVDDAQWIDAASTMALAFALRRLRSDAVSAAIGVRAGESSGFDRAGFDELVLGGLSLEETRELADDDIADQVVKQCWEQTAGNPLALIESMRSLDHSQRSGHSMLPPVLAGGHHLDGLISRRVASLGSGAQAAVAVVAAASNARAAPILAAMAGLDSDFAVLEEAERHGIVQLSAGEVALAHPRYRPAIATAVGANVMRAAHRALAAALGSDDQAAWHLAAASVGPDEEVASRLGAIGTRANSRGDLSLAGRAFEMASSLAVDADSRFRHVRAAAQARWFGGDPERAIELFTTALPLARLPTERADTAAALGDAMAWIDDVDRGIDLMIDAAGEVESTDSAQAAVIYLRAALLVSLAGDGGRHFRLAEKAALLAHRTEASGDDPLTLICCAIRAAGAQLTGRRKVADRDLAVASALVDLPVQMIDTGGVLVLQTIGYAQLMQERHAEAHRTLDLSTAAARRLGAAGMTGFSGALLSEIAFRRGRFTEALVAADHDVSFLERRSASAASFGHVALARAEAALGRFDSAHQHAAAANAWGAATGMKGLQAWALAADGLAFLGQRDPHQALAALLEAARLSAGYSEPSVLWFEGDLAEALIACDRVDDATDLADRLRERAALGGTRWGAAIALRVMGMACSDDGRVQASIDAMTDLDAPFEAARSMLVLGEQFARPEMARLATTEFERLGAVPWAERARRSVAARSVAARSVAAAARNDDRPPPAAALANLTSAELRVASAVARGLSNKEAAEELYLSPRTVEAHLRAVFAKLGLLRRAQLAALFANLHSDVPPASPTTGGGGGTTDK